MAPVQQAGRERERDEACWIDGCSKLLRQFTDDGLLRRLTALDLASWELPKIGMRGTWRRFCIRMRPFASINAAATTTNILFISIYSRLGKNC